MAPLLICREFPWLSVWPGHTGSGESVVILGNIAWASRGRRSFRSPMLQRFGSNLTLRIGWHFMEQKENINAGERYFS